MESLLYQKEFVENAHGIPEVQIFAPTLGNFRLPGEQLGLKAWLVRFSFWLTTGGRFRIFYIREQNQIVHTSCVIPKCMKFPFLKAGEYMIGPCVTAPECRGQGLYGKALACITGHPDYRDGVFYMAVNPNNAPSIRGIEKAGFRLVGKVGKTKWLKRYYRV